MLLFYNQLIFNFLLQYVQQNPPPTLAYSAVQNSVQNQPSHIQIQTQQQPVSQQPQISSNSVPNAPSGQSPVQNQSSSQSTTNVSQPPPSIPNQSSSVQNPPSNQRHSPNIQAPPPPPPPPNTTTNPTNPAFSIQPSHQNQMLLQQIPNQQMMPNNQPVSLQNQNIQTIPASTANFLPCQPQLMQIQGVRPTNEVQQPQFQVQQQNYGQYQQQIVMKQIQVCQPQQLQFVPGCPPGPIQILPASSGQFIPPAHHLPPSRFNQNSDHPEPKPPKRKFTEEITPTTQQVLL